MTLVLTYLTEPCAIPVRLLLVSARIWHAFVLRITVVFRGVEFGNLKEKKRKVDGEGAGRLVGAAVGSAMAAGLVVAAAACGKFADRSA